MTSVGIYYEYFAAATDDEAAAVVHRVGGPGSRDVLVEPVGEPRRNWLGVRKRTEPTYVEDPSLPVYDTASLKFFSPDPDVASIEALVTGQDGDAVAAADYVLYVGEVDEGQTLVMALADRTRDLLAGADAEVLRSAASQYGAAEEYRDDADAEVLGEDLVELAGLARRARDAGLHLFCFVTA